MRRNARLLIAALVGFAPAALAAQGSISAQGFGYPTGQLSPGALGAAGAGGESDPNSALNPAAITQNNRYSILLHIEPEFRSTRLGATRADATIIRFPSFVASGTYKRITASFGVTTLLDRSWSNQYSDSLLVDGDWVSSQIRIGSEGALSDARVALGYVLSPKVQVGVGFHGYAGENRTEYIRFSPDSSNIGGLSQTASFGFAGSAVSLGVVVIPVQGLVIASSFRSGGKLTLEENRKVLARGNVPQRFGVGVNWLAIPGAAFSARVDRTRWTNMDGLGTGAVRVFDATELAVGADVLGPKIAGVNSVVRTGFRTRTLPFEALGEQVGERAFSFGAGIPLGRGRAQIDLAAQRATRTVSGVNERGWLVSFGLGIRP